MRILYTLITFLLGPVLAFLGLFSNKLKKARLVRKSLISHLKAWRVEETRPVIWMHCASLGEYDQGLPFWEKLKAAYPSYAFVVSFFSASGYDHVDHLKAGDYVTYLPFDEKQAMRSFIELLSPQLTVFVKNEVWPHCFEAISSGQGKLILIAGLFRNDHRYFTSLKGLYGPALRGVDHFFVQNEASLVVLNTAGYANVTNAGDPRFERVSARLSALKHFEEVEKYVENRKAVVAGSSWPQEEESCVKQWLLEGKRHALILVPHDISESHLIKIEALAPNQVERWTRLEGAISRDKILLIDTIGMLSHLYQYADIAVVGGAFGDGLHNILEPLVLGKPVIFGPKTSRFPEAQAAIEVGCALKVESREQLESELTRVLADNTFLASASQKAEGWVKAQVGATEGIWKVCEAKNLLPR